MKGIKLILLSFSYLCFTSLLSCGSISESNSIADPISHLKFDELLKKYVSENGTVNYIGFLEEQSKFESYLNDLSKHHPNKTWKKEERLAYWINAYNAFTLKLIIDNYPVASIKDIKKGIPFVNTVWDIKFIKIEKMTYDLNNIEHSIIREKFDDPRIHFAVNCASFSCPRLRNEAYIAERLNEQLEDQTRYFIGNKDKNIISQDHVQLSKLFLWYKGDFKKQAPSVRAFINRYSEIQMLEDAKIDYLDYKWSLNE